MRALVSCGICVDVWLLLSLPCSPRLSFLDASFSTSSTSLPDVKDVGYVIVSLIRRIWTRLTVFSRTTTSRTTVRTTSTVLVAPGYVLFGFFGPLGSVLTDACVRLACRYDGYSLHVLHDRQRQVRARAARYPQGGQGRCPASAGGDGYVWRRRRRRTR
jgi:hypothetical protein